MDLSEAVQAGSLCGAVIAVGQMLIAVGDRLWGSKKNENTQAAAQLGVNSADIMKVFVHAGEIKELLREQNESLKSLVDTLHDSVHNETLRYELLMAKLREIHNSKRDE